MKKIWVMFVGLLIIGLLLANVLAITGSIGNARMIIQANTGEEIEKYVLVKNVNDVPLDINLSASGDLAGSINIKDREFRLNAGEEKKAYFTIKALEPGTTETQINIAFTPEDGHGVGLSSTVILVAKGEAVEDSGGTGGILGWITGGKNSTDTGNENNIIINNQISVINSPVAIGLLSTTIILALLIILLAVYSQKVKKKKEIKPKKKVKQSE